MNGQDNHFRTLITGIILTLTVFSMQSHIRTNLSHIRSVESLLNIFPQDVASLEQAAETYINRAQELIAVIQKIPDEQRTFANTIQAYDHIIGMSDIAVLFNLLYAVTYVYPQREMRDTARKLLTRVEAFILSVGKQLCREITAYANDKASREDLTKEQQYFLHNTIQEFKRAGYYLPAEKFARVTTLRKELSELSLTYVRNINEDKSCIHARAEELAGVQSDFIATLEQDGFGNYIVGVDNPTMTQVLPYATNGETRKRLWLAYNNRAYPHNDAVLREIIAKRHKLAELLGFSSYAAFELQDQMAETPERAQSFIEAIIARTQKKAEQECDLLIAHLPHDVTLAPDGKLYPWDRKYVAMLAEQNELNIDEREIAEYFSAEPTIQGILNIYAQFFSLRFESKPFNAIWAEKVTLLTVYRQDEEAPIGYVILDLFPRADKYNHAVHLNLIPATYTSEGNRTRATSLVVANLAPAQGDKPALFTRSDVSTFFHEFGHALHALLGRTKLASVAGTRVKRDFVEMPSQMLEEWMCDSAILKALSKHYITGKPLSDDLVERIQKLKNFWTGIFAQRDALFAMLSLTLFSDNQPINDIEQVWSTLSKRIVTSEAFSPDCHWYAAFWHLTGYGAKYYGYLWSQVFALDLFKKIKQQGLLNPTVGACYIEKVIGRGGSADPQELLRDFLGRKPNDEAFYESMGL